MSESPPEILTVKNATDLLKAARTKLRKINT